jgi:putative hydrolase of the HAD superfamily
LRIARAERVAPASVFYIADNPAKDFVGIRPLGFRTIRLLQGPHASVDRGSGYDAEVSIGDLDQLTWTLLQSMTAATGQHRARRRSS